MSYFQALILAIIEGLTEFLPVSSTGHMIIGSSLMGISSDEFTKVFTVQIQFGTILSVVFLYWKRFLQSIDIQFYLTLLVAFIPAAIFGKLLGDKIDELLENVQVVALMLVLGGIFFLFLDKIFPEKTQEDQEISYPKAVIIGIFQCIAMVPGVSRSAATIIGGLSQGLSRKQAAEFSFFLAVPTMFAASAYKLTKDFSVINSENIKLLGFGNLVGFLVGILAIRFFIGIISKYGFKIFGYYRIALGLGILILLYLGVDLKIV
ncbi:MAG: undecaprenyl-diphosphate phosphatase [Bacteroidia bacterium]|nr:undecaprenyl-diphosphate phosphatase [Bacteroidia bacterium]